MDVILQPAGEHPEDRDRILAALGGGVEAEARTLIPGLCRILCDDEEVRSPRSSDAAPATDAPEPVIDSRREAAAAVLQQFPVEVIRAEMEREVNPDLCCRLISTMGCEPISVADAALRVLWALDSLAADSLLQALRSGADPMPGGDRLGETQAIALVQLVARCGDPRATEVLCESVTQSPLQLSRLNFLSVAIKTLGDMRDARAVPVIAEFLKSEIQSLRLLAAEALGKIGHRSALPELHRLLSFRITWGDSVVNDNWVERLLTTQVLTYELDPEVRAAVKQSISLIEQTAPAIADLPLPATHANDSEPEIGDLPVPAMPGSEPESSDLSRPVD